MQASKINFQKLNSDLKNNFPVFKTFVDANTAYNVFFGTTQNKIVMRTTTLKKNRITHDWTKPSIIKSCHKKNLSRKKYLKGLIMKES